MKYKNQMLSILIAGIILLQFACDKIEPPFIENNNIDTIINPTNNIQKVLIEDFTGHKCGNCPRAHEEAEMLKTIYGDQVVIIAYHIGFFATTNPTAAPNYTTDFTTPSGNEYDNLWGISAIGLPQGMINRNNYAGNNIVNYPTWSNIVQDYDNDNDGLFDNIAVLKITNNITLNSNNIECAVNIKGLNNSTNESKVVVCLVEDNIIDWQKDYDACPSDIENYTHNHVFRKSLNGAWGNSIGTITNNTDTTINLSQSINPDWDINNCSIISYVYNADNYEIIQVEETKISNTN